MRAEEIYEIPEDLPDRVIELVKTADDMQRHLQPFFTVGEIAECLDARFGDVLAALQFPEVFEQIGVVPIALSWGDRASHYLYLVFPNPEWPTSARVEMRLWSSGWFEASAEKKVLHYIDQHGSICVEEEVARKLGMTLDELIAAMTALQDEGETELISQCKQRPESN